MLGIKLNNISKTGLWSGRTSLMTISQYWFRQWFGDVKQDAIVWTNVEKIYDAICRY